MSEKFHLTIWKYEIEATDRLTISIPKGAQFLSVQVQRQNICVWFLVNPKLPPEDRFFSIYGTGHVIPMQPGTYLGTFQLMGGSLVFHLFEESQ